MSNPTERSRGAVTMTTTTTMTAATTTDTMVRPTLSGGSALTVNMQLLPAPIHATAPKRPSWRVGRICPCRCSDATFYSWKKTGTDDVTDVDDDDYADDDQDNDEDNAARGAPAARASFSQITWAVVKRRSGHPNCG